MIKAYLAAPIFTERDRDFNEKLNKAIKKECPELDLYLAQNNASINDKRGCASPIDIYIGDVRKLKNADFIISIMSGDLPPIGSSYETSYYCGLCEQDENKKIFALYDDSREGSITYSDEKRDSMLEGIGHSQWPYINLLAVGYVEKNGYIFHTLNELVIAVKKYYDILIDERKSGIYKITNLKNNLVYIGQTIDFHKRKLDHWRLDCSHEKETTLHRDMKELGEDYFKFDILEKCNENELDEREKYWIEYYDSYNNGYNSTTGENHDKTNISNSQCIEVYSYDLEGNFIEKFNSIASAVRSLGLKSNNITRCISFNDNCHMSANRMWSYKYVEKMEPYKKPNSQSGITIYSYDINTRIFIKEYINALQAGIELTGKRQPHINDVANGARRSCAGFIWAYDYYDRLPDDYFNKKQINKSSFIEEEEEYSKEH